MQTPQITPSEGPTVASGRGETRGRSQPDVKNELRLTHIFHLRYLKSNTRYVYLSPRSFPCVYVTFIPSYPPSFNIEVYYTVLQLTIMDIDYLVFHSCLLQ